MRRPPGAAATAALVLLGAVACSGGVPKPRDPLTDVQALVLQVVDALAIPVDENAPRPKAPPG